MPRKRNTNKTPAPRIRQADHIPMRRLIFTLSHTQCAKLEGLRRIDGVGASEFMRRCLDWYLLFEPRINAMEQRLHVLEERYPPKRLVDLGKIEDAAARERYEIRMSKRKMREKPEQASQDVPPPAPATPEPTGEAT